MLELDNHKIIHIGMNDTTVLNAFRSLRTTVLSKMKNYNSTIQLSSVCKGGQTTMAFQLLAVYGFFSMCMFGAIYFIVPRLVGCEWVSGRRIRFHFWYSTYGMIALVILHFLGGAWQSQSYAQFDVPLENVPEPLWEG